MLNPDFSEAPCFAWYELAYRHGMLTLDIEPSAFAFLASKLTADNPRVHSVQVAFQLDEFVPAESTCWGFGRVIEAAGESPRGWRRFLVRYPRMLRTGDERSWRPAYGIVGTLNLVFRALHAWTTPAPQPDHQVLLVDGPGLQQGGLGAGISPRAATWLQQPPRPNELEQIRYAMLSASRALGDEYDPVDDLRLFILQNSDGLLHLGMPSRVGLHPTFHEVRKRGNGYEIHCHNVDTPYQQLVLIAGLAKLSELVRA
ncbi:MAG: hypothetical protein UY72_C0047G0007 [Candidatus Uhrbacteria bacterium GW2011_GWD2_52_7]|uniref:Uncharacterized protein n=1 Tax=Candidatus Uhrbacteria bacterium GW2011_GWD2_52_7 TaxID=1618989 RepID=A0A0G1XEI5_9BACT|nr:MAG: hypothetical protein UY72_C0047G0007 [Candidatus Uhrbacteria bacterium GW2011_GWD2_52_7]